MNCANKCKLQEFVVVPDDCFIHDIRAVEVEVHCIFR